MQKLAIRHALDSKLVKGLKFAQIGSEELLIGVQKNRGELRLAFSVIVTNSSIATRKLDRIQEDDVALSAEIESLLEVHDSDRETVTERQ